MPRALCATVPLFRNLLLGFHPYDTREADPINEINELNEHGCNEFQSNVRYHEAAPERIPRSGRGDVP